MCRIASCGEFNVPLGGGDRRGDTCMEKFRVNGVGLGVKWVGGYLQIFLF